MNILEFEKAARINGMNRKFCGSLSVANHNHVTFPKLCKIIIPTFDRASPTKFATKVRYMCSSPAPKIFVCDVIICSTSVVPDLGIPTIKIGQTSLDFEPHSMKFLQILCESS